MFLNLFNVEDLWRDRSLETDLKRFAGKGEREDKNNHFDLLKICLNSFFVKDKTSSQSAPTYETKVKYIF